MTVRLLDLVRRLYLDRLFNIATGWRDRLRKLVLPKDSQEEEKLHDSLGASIKLVVHFSEEGAFVPFEWSTEVGERTVLEGTFQKEFVIQDDLGPGKVLTFDKRHVRYLPEGADWPAIIAHVNRASNPPRFRFAP